MNAKQTRIIVTTSIAATIVILGMVYGLVTLSSQAMAFEEWKSTHEKEFIEDLENSTKKNCDGLLRLQNSPDYTSDDEKIVINERIDVLECIG